MTYLALSLSTYVNGVAKLHGETSRKMFPQVTIEASTDGGHAGTWASPAFQELFDRCIPSWREDNYSLRCALGLPPEEVWASHLIAKHELFETVRKKTGLSLDPEAFTIGFARRARSEEHTSELHSLTNLVCRLLLEKKKTQNGQDAHVAKPNPGENNQGSC